MTDPNIKRKHPAAICEQCSLANAPMVPTSGPENAPVAFVSRSPGKHDVRTGRPFGGPSGKVLDHLLQRYGVTREQILTTNVVLCSADDPPLQAIKACRPRLESEIARCDLVIAGGAEATKILTSYKGVTSGRGFGITRYAYPDGKEKRQRVVVTNNPAAVMRNSDLYPDMVQDFKRAFDPPPPPIMPKVEIIDDPTVSGNILRTWLATKFDSPLASDLEWRGDWIACAGFARTSSKAVVFTSEAISGNESLLRQFYERDDISFIWHNGKSDTTILVKNGIQGRVDEDTFLMSYCLDERPGYHALEYLLSSEFGWPDYEPASVKHFKKTGEFKEPTRRSKHELYQYNGYDTAGTLMLHEKYAAKIEEEDQTALYRRLLHAANRFRTVEMNGFPYDVEQACNVHEAEVLPRLWEVEEQMREVSGRTLLNARSNKQINAVMYEQFGLKHQLKDSGKKKLKTSVGKEVREEIKDGRFVSKPRHRAELIEFSAAYERFQKVDTIRKNFIEGLVRRVDKDGKIYCHFNICGTATGRTSSNDPNLQNIIREGFEEIPSIRTIFLPSPGNVLISADYSQAELRTCAKLSGDEGFLNIYRDSSRSLHKERAAIFYGENYTYEQYVKAKNINFGVTYGQSAAAFAQMYHMPEREAQDYINVWWRDFPQLKGWTNEVAAQAIKNGFVRSPFGHKRRFYLVTDENIGDVRREAVNFKPQNIAAWLTIHSVCDLVDSGVRVIATVHDSIVADVPVSEATEVAFLMKNIMVKQPITQLGWSREDIPFEVDVSMGENWGSLEEVEFDKMAA